MSIDTTQEPRDFAFRSPDRVAGEPVGHLRLRPDPGQGGPGVTQFLSGLTHRSWPAGETRVGHDGRLVGQVDPATSADDQHGALVGNASLSPADSAIRPPRWQVLRSIENPAETNRAAGRPYEPDVRLCA
jgi:hypothetical protein